jgi:hypothetical protein
VNASVPLSARFGTASDLVEVLAVLSMQVSGDGRLGLDLLVTCRGETQHFRVSPTEAEAI